jgi:hypothetical protein
MCSVCIGRLVSDLERATVPPILMRSPSHSVCVTSILRITTLNIATAHTDTTWQSIDSSMWTVIESNLGIICACMPAFKQPLSCTFPWLFARMGRTETKDRYDTLGSRRHVAAAKTVAGNMSWHSTRVPQGLAPAASEHSLQCAKQPSLGAYALRDLDTSSRRESQDPILSAAR